MVAVHATALMLLLTAQHHIGCAEVVIPDADWVLNLEHRFRCDIRTIQLQGTSLESAQVTPELLMRPRVANRVLPTSKRTTAYWTL